VLGQKPPLASQRVGLWVPHPEERVHARQRLALRERVGEAIASLDIVAESTPVRGCEHRVGAEHGRFGAHAVTFPDDGVGCRQDIEYRLDRRAQTVPLEIWRQRALGLNHDPILAA